MGLIIKGPPSQGYQHFPYDFRHLCLSDLNMFFRVLLKASAVSQVSPLQTSICVFSWVDIGLVFPIFSILKTLTGVRSFQQRSSPIGSMYGIFTYIWLIFMVNVGKYTIHGSYGSGKIKNARYLSLTPRKSPLT